MPPASLDNKPRGGSASEFEDELAEISQEDERALAESDELEQQYAMEMEEEQNKDRTQNRLKDLAENYAKVEAKAIATKAVKSAAVTAARSAIVATAPYWGSALAILSVIVLLFVVIIAAVDYKCNEDGVQGIGTRIASTVASQIGFIPTDICEMLREGRAVIGLESPSPVAPDPASPESDLVPLTGFPLSNVSNPQVRACFLPGVTNIMQKAQAAGLNVVITSAYRPGVNTATGGVSAHARGEAVDFGLRPVGSIGDPAFQAKIRTLVNIARDEGFIGAAGDTLDEYNNPAENATGGHVHVEFNAGYCDQAI